LRRQIRKLQDEIKNRREEDEQKITSLNKEISNLKRQLQEKKKNNTEPAVQSKHKAYSILWMSTIPNIEAQEQIREKFPNIEIWETKMTAECLEEYSHRLSDPSASMVVCVVVSLAANPENEDEKMEGLNLVAKFAAKFPGQYPSIFVHEEASQSNPDTSAEISEFPNVFIMNSIDILIQELPTLMSLLKKNERSGDSDAVLKEIQDLKFSLSNMMGDMKSSIEELKSSLRTGESPSVPEEKQISDGDAKDEEEPGLAESDPSKSPKTTAKATKTTKVAPTKTAPAKTAVKTATKTAPSKTTPTKTSPAKTPAKQPVKTTGKK